MIHFGYGENSEAIVYRHYDGYDIPDDMKDFFTELKENVNDTRFNNPTYLAAKFIVWQAHEYTKKTDYQKESHYLDFLGVSPSLENHDDIDVCWLVNCNQSDDNGFPVVKKVPLDFGEENAGVE